MRVDDKLRVSPKEVWSVQNLSKYCSVLLPSPCLPSSAPPLWLAGGRRADR